MVGEVRTRLRKYAIPVTGRCFVRFQERERYQEISSHHTGLSKLAFLGNSYYEKRLGSSQSARRHDGQTSRGVVQNGDFLIELSSSPFLKHLEHRRIVDVSGVETNYFNAAEHCPTSLATLPEVLGMMHWHDGSTVPELCRGNLRVGRLLVRAAFDSSGVRPSWAPSGQTEAYVVENAAEFLMGRPLLDFASKEDGQTMIRALTSHVQMIASRCKLQPQFTFDDVEGTRSRAIRCFRMIL